uniref:Uncharacterized protein n=1 Tax=Rhizophora mucronata TaxID=61149 RepID=A0A2P2J2T7_RHIMU
MPSHSNSKVLTFQSVEEKQKLVFYRDGSDKIPSKTCIVILAKKKWHPSFPLEV